MAVLRRKLRRDLVGSTGTLITIVAIIAVGTGSFVGLRTAQLVLQASQADYYSDYRFADFWVDVKKAPLSAVEDVAKLPGIAKLETRVIFEVILDLPGVVKPLTGRLISMPKTGFDKTINGICLIRGSGFSDDRNEEVILSEAFAKEHGLEPGDRIELILNRKRESFVIVGTAISPEYVYMVRGEGDIIPDPQHFGTLYVKEEYAREVLDFQDACNQVVGRLAPGYSGDVELLLDRVDRMLDAYGVLATTPRERQASNRFLSDEIKSLAVTAAIMPSIFLLVAALVLNILMSRLADRQRTIIGTLKALGYSDRTVLGHFLSFGIVVGLAGGVVGDCLGIALAAGMIEMYKEFYEFPAFAFQVYPGLLVVGVLISLAFALAGTAKGVWAVLKLEPAESMRPKPPERGGAVFLEKLPFIWRRLSFRTHIALRSLLRNRFRTATGVLSSALATAIILVSLVFFDSMWYLVQFQFEMVAHSDADIGMRDERSIAAMLEGRDLPGVDYAEPLLGLVCDLRHGRHSRRLAITGLPRRHRLTTPLQADLSPIDIPPSGVVLSRKLAEILHAERGDRLEITPVRGRRETVCVRLDSIVEGFLGLECYADLDYLSEVVGESQAVNSLQLAVNPLEADNLYRAIKELPNAQGLGVRGDTKANLESTFIKTITFSLGLIIVFAGVIAFGSILNSSLIEIGDRIRDIATFRVLGYRSGHVAGIFLRQNLAIFVVGLALGLPLGYGMALAAAKGYDTELFRMPVIVKSRTVLVTTLLSLGFVLVAQMFVHRQIHRLDWVEGVKIKE
ncbi:MAG: ABC transporter permease [Phycisphaerae bacterium]|nr:ABC transporter permease [Phycisphaerae bacterium]